MIVQQYYSKRREVVDKDNQHHPIAMGNRFTCLGQSLDMSAHSAEAAQYQAKQLSKAVLVINQ